jgi:CBS domain containing-hemolysin-like protein
MKLFLILLSLGIYGFFSAAEIIFLSVSRLRIEGYLRRGVRSARYARWFLEKPSRFILTVLVGSTIVNIAFASLLTALLEARGITSGLILLLTFLPALLFGEIIPKSIARESADRAILWVGPALRFFQIVLYPAIWVSRAISDVILGFFGVAREEVRTFFTRRDLEVLLLHEGLRAGSLKMRQGSLLARVFRLPGLAVYEIMTPRTEIVALEKTATLEDLRSTILDSGFTKIPIYETDLDHVVGVAYARDLLDNPSDLAAIIKPVPFIPEYKKSSETFRDLRNLQQMIAIVVDEWGGTAGLVTLEDVIEEITGDIEDEYDRTQTRMRSLGQGKWLVAGRVDVKDLNQRLKLAIPVGDYETLGGYLITQIGRIPTAGETFTLDEVLYKIARSSPNRVDMVVIMKAET